MPGADPALIRIEPDIVIVGVGVASHPREDEFLPVTPHWVRKAARFRDVVGRQLK